MHLGKSAPAGRTGGRPHSMDHSETWLSGRPGGSNSSHDFQAGSNGRARGLSTSGLGSLAVPTLVGSAAALATAALYNTLAARQAERVHPPIGRFMTIDGVRCITSSAARANPGAHPRQRYHDPRLHRQRSRGQAGRPLSGDRHLIGPATATALARGGSGRPARMRAVWKALQRLGVAQATILGHSWGTLVAVALALEAPGLVRSLVLGPAITIRR